MADRASRAAERRAARGQVDDPAVVMEAAGAFLTVRPRSIAETRRRLAYLGYRREVADEAIAKLVELGYLDDDSFARTWVESRDRARPRGEVALRRELSLKGVTRDVVDRVLDEREPVREPSNGSGAVEPAQSADRAAAARLLDRRRAALQREPDPRRRRQRAYALLARNGFDPDVARDAAASFAASAPDDEPSP